jgi:hypothetical protein
MLLNSILIWQKIVMTGAADRDNKVAVHAFGDKVTETLASNISSEGSDLAVAEIVVLNT